MGYPWNKGLRKRITCVCETCGSKFEVFPSRLKWGAPKFCSMKCKRHTEETKRKMSHAHKGKPNSGQFKKDSIPWNKNKKNCFSKEVIDKMRIRSQGNKYAEGHKLSKEKRKEISIKTKQGMTLEVRKKMSNIKKQNPSQYWLNKKRSEETKIKISLKNSGEEKFNGFKSSERKLDLKSKKTQEWRNLVFERDNYTCQTCGVKGAYLEAHHIKAWAKYPRLRYILSNGMTLCLRCHNKTKNGRKK